MAKNKKYKTIVNKREIDLLNKYYEIDNENRIATMPLHYEKASDLINNKIISKDNYLFDYDELTLINDMIKRIPIMYKVNIDLQIDDYEDYDSKELLAGFNDAMELNQYNYQRENRFKFLKAAILLLVGISILFTMAYAKLNGLFGSDDRASVYSEILDIIGWVFIWEMVTVAFLTPSELGVNSNMFKLRVRNVSFSNSNKEILATENLTDKAREWDSERRIEKASRLALLISGVSFLSLGSIDLIDLLTSLPSYFSVYEGEVTASAIFTLIGLTALTVVITIVEIFGGISALRMYASKRVKKVFPIIFSVLLFAVLIIKVSLFGISTTSGFARNIIAIILDLFYFFGLYSYIIIERNKRKNDQKIVKDSENSTKIEENDIKK